MCFMSESFIDAENKTGCSTAESKIETYVYALFELPSVSQTVVGQYSAGVYLTEA